jgi:hypothetical protein
MMYNKNGKLIRFFSTESEQKDKVNKLLAELIEKVKYN